MSKWIDVDLNERQIMIRRVSQEKNFADSAAEKDWWVTLCLKAIFSTPYAPYMLFKGGTSLSKGWNIISRFSEDIDLTEFDAGGYQWKVIDCDPSLSTIQSMLY